MSGRGLRWLSLAASISVLVACMAIFLPPRAESLTLGPLLHVHAVPQFSRRYNVKCSACHTIAPVLNEQGWMFKRLGFHLPPALEEGKSAPLISDLVEKEPQWTLTNNVAPAVTDFSYSAERTTQQGTSPVSTSAFQVASWNMYMGGWLPDTNFFYFAEFDIVTGGTTNPDLANAFFGYSGGNAHSSWYAAGGREHLQIGNGTRAAQIYSLLPNSPLLFENPSPTTFIFDQSPVDIDVGYTLASSSYKRVFAASTKVTNGDNADGSEILAPSNRNSKDVWTDIDFWYAPESGVTFLNYYGKKDNLQTDLFNNQFTFHPVIRRQGVFGNYKLLSKVDFLGGWLHSHDGWVAPDLSSANFIGNDLYGAIDYYIVQGFAVSGRFDRLNQRITGPTGVGPQNTHDWTAGVSKTLTPSGDIVGRIAYSNLLGRDPVAALKNTDKLFQVDIAFNF
jgi:hypothetical protein